MLACDLFVFINNAAHFTRVSLRLKFLDPWTLQFIIDFCFSIFLFFLLLLKSISIHKKISETLDEHVNPAYAGTAASLAFEGLLKGVLVSEFSTYPNIAKNSEDSFRSHLYYFLLRILFRVNLIFFSTNSSLFVKFWKVNRIRTNQMILG